MELTGGDYVVTGDYPGWKYRVHSHLKHFFHEECGEYLVRVLGTKDWLNLSIGSQKANKIKRSKM